MSDSVETAPGTEQPSLETSQEASQTPAQPEAAPTQSPQVQRGLQILMDRERSIRQQQAEVKQQMEQLKELQELKQLAGSDKNALLRKLGVELPKPADEQELPPQVQEMQKRLQELERREQEVQWQATLREEVGRVGTWIGEREDFPYLKALGEDGANAVINHALQHYNGTGEYLSDEAAAREVEKQFSTLAERWATIQRQSGNVSNQPGGMTLHNGLGSEINGRGEAPLESDEENLRRMAIMLGADPNDLF